MEERLAEQQGILSNENARFLGISVSAHSFGFVVIENKTALDCGVRTCYRDQFDQCLGDRFERILRAYHPSEVIILSARSKAANQRTAVTREAIKNTSITNEAPVVHIRASALRLHFAQYNAQTKHEVALAVARIFPELAWHLPPKRKPWQNEHYRMAIFQAAGAVITHGMA